MSERLQQHVGRLRERFELEERIGEGGFGTVYRAVDLARDAEVALKVLHEFDAENLYRFKREFRALSDLAHRNLVTLYELGSADDLWFFTMELIHGDDLVVDLCGEVSTAEGVREERRSEGARTLQLKTTDPTIERTARESPPMALDSEPESSEMAASVESSRETSGGRGAFDAPEVDVDRLRARFRDLVGALEVLHAAGKLHRDIKPSNVLVEEERVVVLDFGMVADLFRGRADEATGSEERRFVGTPRYAAPEQAAGRASTEASDWYAVGVMLYEILTGFVPIDGPSTRDILVRKRTVRPVDIRDVRPDVPEEIAGLAMDLLASRPERRPGPDEIRARLDIESSGEGGGVRVEGTGGPGEVFIGREREREICRAAFLEAAREERSAIVRLVGESGIGKTALVEEVVSELRSKHTDVHVLRGRCYENESVPYKALDALVDELSRRLRSSGFDLEEMLPAGEVRALIQVFPVLGRVGSVEMPPRESEKGGLESELRDDAVRGLRGLLSAFAEGMAPLVLFLDDVQWGDRDSAELLARILRAGRPPVVLFVTYRDDEVEHSEFLHVLDEGLAGASSVVRDERVALEPLSVAESKRLAGRLMGDGRSAKGWSERIARETGGSPYFIDELARSLREEGDEDWSVQHLDELIGRRVGELAPEARRLLEVVSVSGRPVERPVARSVAELGDAGPAAVETLRARRLVRLRRTRGVERLQTYHDRVRETVAGGLEESRRRTLHRSLARRLEAEGAEAERLSDHRLRAGDRELAAMFAVDAARDAADALAYDRAVRMLQRALELGSWLERERYELHRHRASMLERLARCGEAAEAYRRAGEETSGVRALAVRVRSAEQLMSAGRPAPALERLYAVVEELDVDVPRRESATLLPRLLWRRASLWRRDFDDESHLSDAVPARERVALRALSVIGGILATMDLTGSAYYQMVYLERSIRTGDAAHLGAALTMHALREGASTPRDERVWRWLDVAESLGERSDESNRIRIVAGLVRGVLLYSRGDWRRSDEAFRRVMEDYDPLDSGSMWEFQTLRFYSLMPLFWLGAFERYQALVPELLEQAREQGNRLLEVAGHSWAYLERLKEDEPREAVEGLDRARRRWNAEGYQLPNFWQMLGRGETLVYRGDSERAWELVRRHWWPLHRSFLMQVEIIYVLMHHLRGRLALTAASGEQSRLRRGWYRAWARRSARKLEATDGAYTTGIARMLQGELAATAGDRERAIERYASARELLQSTDTHFYATAAKRRLGRLRGGEDGGELVDEADAWLRSRGVRSPEKMAAMATARLRQG